MMDVPVIHLTMAAVKMGKHLPKDQTRKNVKVVRHLNSDVALMGLLQLRERIWKERTISYFVFKFGLESIFLFTDKEFK